MESCWDGRPSSRFFSLWGGESSVRVTVGLLIISLIVARQLTLPNFFCLTFIDATVLLGTLRASENVLDPCTDVQYVSQQNIITEVCKEFLNFIAWALSWHAVWTVGPYIGVCLSKLQYEFIATDRLQSSSRYNSGIIKANRRHLTTVQQSHGILFWTSQYEVVVVLLRGQQN